MQYSIRKKMFLTSIITTMFSFLIIFICFNLIINNHIEKEALSQLNNAISTTENFSISVTINNNNYSGTIASDVNVYGDKSASDSVSAEEIRKAYEVTSDADNMQDYNIDMQKIHADTYELIDYVDASLIIPQSQSSDVNYFLVNSYDNSLIYPYVPNTSTINSSTRFYRDYEIIPILNYVSENDVFSPKKVTLNNTSYYVTESPVNENIKAIFYTNVQPLKNLSNNINIILLGLLFLSGTIIITLTMGFSNGMIRSIQKLCLFANNIGSGNLQPQNLSLKEKELSVLENDMNDMAKKLSEHDEEQKKFFQNVSHELKTPLMSIQGYAEGITSHVFEEEKAAEAAEIILSESDRLTEMINNLICLSKMDSNDRIEKNEKFDIAYLLKELAEKSKDISNNKNIIYVQKGDEFIVSGNKEEFKTAILNIISNCIRYAKTQIYINCNCEKRYIKICDDGEGICEKDMPYIFKRFYKGKDGCSGIGLAITYAAIKNMNGIITAENDNGAVFNIKL